MAENQTNKDTDKPETTKPPVAVQKAKVTEITEEIVIPTNSFDATKPELVELAELTFRENVVTAYGDSAKLEDVRLVKVNHHVGTSATYFYAGKLTV